MKNSISLKYILAPFIAFGVVLAILLSGVLQSSVADAQQAPASISITQVEPDRYLNRLRISWSAVQGATQYQYASQSRAINGEWSPAVAVYKSFSTRCNNQKYCHYNATPGAEHRFFIRAGENGTPAQKSYVFRMPQVTKPLGEFKTNTRAELRWTPVLPLWGTNQQGFSTLSSSSKYHYRIVYGIRYKNTTGNEWRDTEYDTDHIVPFDSDSPNFPDALLGNSYEFQVQARLQFKQKTCTPTLSNPCWRNSKYRVGDWSDILTYTHTDPDSSPSGPSGQDNNQGSSQTSTSQSVTSSIRVRSKTDSSLILSWNEQTGATYDLQYGPWTPSRRCTFDRTITTSSNLRTLTGLEADTIYCARIRVRQGGSSTDTEPPYPTTPRSFSTSATSGGGTSTPTSLATPQIRVSRQTSNSFTVAWNEVTGALQYAIECFTGTSSSGTRIISESISSTRRSYEVGSVAPSTTSYYCRVKAVAGSVSSEYGSVQAGTSSSGTSGGDNNQDSSTLAKVQGLSVERGSGNRLDVEWRPVSGANSYEVSFRRIDGNNVHTWRTSANIVSSPEYAIETSTTYVVVFRVRAKNSTGATGPWSDFASANSNVVLAIPQTIRTTVTPNSESVTVNWDSVSGSNIVYDIAYKEVSDGWNARSSGAQRTYSITVPYGKTYEIIVRARNSNTAQGIWSEPVRVTNTGSAPPVATSLSAPQNVRVSRQTSNSFTVAWNEVTGALQYAIECFTGTSSSGTRIISESISSTRRSYEVGSVAPSTTSYYCRVKAVAGSVSSNYGSVQVGTRSSPPPTTPTPPLQRVTNLEATSKTHTSISLEWDSQANATYDVWHCVQGRCSEWTKSTASSNQATISNLSANTRYLINVRAKRGSVEGNWREPSIIVATNEAPAPPTGDPPDGPDDPPPPLQRVSGIATTERTSGKISLSWNSQTNATYDVWYCVYTSCATWTESTASSHQKTISNLTANTEYAFIIRAKRGSTLGPWPANNDFFRARTQAGSGNPPPPPPPTGVPPQVQGVSYRAVSSTELSVVWNAITGATYDVEYVQNGQSNWQRIETSNITTRISNLSPSTTYVIRVRANNAQGAGAWSGIVRGATLAGATTSLPQVTGLRSTRINDTSVDLIWNPVAGVQYEVRRTSATNSTPTVTPAPQNFTTVQCLNPSTQYFFTVRALNSNGQTGTWSETIPATTAPRGQSPDFSINTGTTNCPSVGSGPTPPPPTRPSNFRDGDIVRVPGTYDVYILKMIDGNGKKFKRLILNPQIFDSYGHLRWENIKDITRQDLQSFVTSNLVREVYANGQAVNNNIYALYPQGDVGTKRLVTGGYYDASSVYNINHLEAGDSFYATGQPVNLASDDYGISVAAAPRVQVTSTRPTLINIQYNATPNATEYLVEWRVRYSNNNFWSFKTNRTTASIWGHITPNTEYEIYVTPLSATGVSGVKSTPVYARSS